ncbi:MAG: isocitrate dehydrogenase kinase/phosphatase [Chitinophagales bacterium]|nr:MAG: isocitrate dehydrogenase kinase/phosphatase [Chitinophagales bacterium]
MIAPDIIQQAALLIAEGFYNYRNKFMEITRRARLRFERRNWHGIQYDSKERLELYKRESEQVLYALKKILGDLLTHKEVWRMLKAVYQEEVRDRKDYELAETFYNSLIRKTFPGQGVDEEIEFVQIRDEPLVNDIHELCHVFPFYGSTYETIKGILSYYPFFVSYDNPDYYIHLISNRIKEQLVSTFGDFRFDRMELIRPVFFRNKGAYIIGRIVRGSQVMPFILALLNPFDTGIIIDAVLLTETDASLIFSFTRSYFLVDVENTLLLMKFLKSIMPEKRRSELYNSIGCDKHGKTVLFREIQKHLSATTDRFEWAPGVKGMVMAVFTLPTMNIVFKVIKDVFDPPKNTTRQKVMEKYRIVFLHDRAGRLADAQEFEYLVYERNRFDPALLEELLHTASRSIMLDEDRVVLKHCYIERKMTPLNIYLQHASEKEAIEAIIDYGNAIKELAAVNIFPGDLLIKNFGVTRHGRVVFYDYDELCFVTECNFRRLPAARDEEEELSGEPWYSVNENDVFPEELKHFLLPPGRLADAFLQHHADIFTVEFWHTMQQRQERGEILDVYPYRREQRFHKRVI